MALLLESSHYYEIQCVSGRSFLLEQILGTIIRGNAIAIGKHIRLWTAFVVAGSLSLEDAHVFGFGDLLWLQTTKSGPSIDKT